MDWTVVLADEAKNPRARLAAELLTGRQRGSTTGRGQPFEVHVTLGERPTRLPRRSFRSLLLVVALGLQAIDESFVAFALFGLPAKIPITAPCSTK